MKKNVSEVIRGLIGEGAMNSIEIHDSLNGSLSKRHVRSIIREMVKSGILVKASDKIPYKYAIGRKSERETPYSDADVEAVRTKIEGMEGCLADKIRAAVKLMPMHPRHIVIATGYTKKTINGSLFDMARRGYIERLEDGRYSFVKDPSLKPRNRGRDIMRNVSVASAKPEKVDAWKDAEGETVEAFLARGGKIDYSETIHKFENLTHEEITQKVGLVSIGYQSPMQRSFTQGY